MKQAPTNFNDGVRNNNGTYDKEHSWKLNIYETFINRGQFRIHSTALSWPNKGDEDINNIKPNEGCISPYGAQAVYFYNEIKNILDVPNKVIPLYINIIGNRNITRNVYKKIEDGPYTDVIPNPEYFRDEKGDIYILVLTSRGIFNCEPTELQYPTQ